MAAKLRLGFAGLVHDHVWDLAPRWREVGVEFVAADPNEPLRDRMESDFGVVRTYESFTAMLETDELDIVQVGTANAPFDECAGAARGRSVQEILHAGLISIAENREVALPLS